MCRSEVFLYLIVIVSWCITFCVLYFYISMKDLRCMWCMWSVNILKKIRNWNTLSEDNIIYEFEMTKNSKEINV